MSNEAWIALLGVVGAILSSLIMATVGAFVVFMIKSAAFAGRVEAMIADILQELKDGKTGLEKCQDEVDTLMGKKGSGDDRRIAKEES